VYWRETAVLSCPTISRAILSIRLYKTRQARHRAQAQPKLETRAMTYEQFKARFPGHIPAAMQDELRAFIESVLDMSDDYDHWVARLRATGKFKSIFGGFNTSRTTTMTTTTESVLSEKERRLYPRDLYKTIRGIAQNGKKPTGLSGAISDFLSEKNPQLGGMANGMMKQFKEMMREVTAKSPNAAAIPKLVETAIRDSSTEHQKWVKDARLLQDQARKLSG
jgi:hypothetical protein